MKSCFFDSNYWSDEDCAILADRMQDISFCYQDSQEKGPSQEVLIETRNTLKSLVLERFKTSKILWDTHMKFLMPTLKLSSPDYKHWKRSDIDQVKELIGIIQSLPVKESAELVQQRQQLQNHLLLKFKNCHPSFNRSNLIQWSTVTILSWPESVIFYNSNWWSAQDIAILAENIDKIDFQIKQTALCSSDRESLIEELRAISRTHFGCYDIPWEALKREFPHLHLSLPTSNFWNTDDVRQIEAIIRRYNSLSENLATNLS